jgi:hypothetical protein
VHTAPHTAEVCLVPRTFPSQPVESFHLRTKLSPPWKQNTTSF